jgi:hypothetical protein
MVARGYLFPAGSTDGTDKEKSTDDTDGSDRGRHPQMTQMTQIMQITSVARRETPDSGPAASRKAAGTVEGGAAQRQVALESNGHLSLGCASFHARDLAARRARTSA